MTKRMLAAAENHAEGLYDAVFTLASACYTAKNSIYSKMGERYLTYLADIREESGQLADMSVE